MDLDRRRVLQALASAPLLAGGLARAQGWANHTVSLVVPWPAGNPTDGLARKMQPLLNKAVGQVVLVENVPGAGGTLGVSKVLAAPADGHTVLAGTPTELILTPLSMIGVRYQPSDFRMVGLFGRAPYVLVSRADLPQRTLADLLAARGRKDAKPLSYGSIGAGSLIHLISAQFGKMAGLDLLHVPYKGVPPMTQDLMGGQIDLGFIPVNGAAWDMIQGGKLRAYGISTEQPYALFPQLVPLAAQSPQLKGFNYDVWGGFHVPKSVPGEVAESWHKLFYQVTADADFRSYARDTGTDLAPPMTMAQLEAFYDGAARQYQSLAKAIGVTPV